MADKVDIQKLFKIIFSSLEPCPIRIFGGVPKKESEIFKI